MSSLVIVAIPTEDDYVNKISSQQVAHMTLFFLGEVNTVKNLDSILGYIQHAASQSLSRFGMEVDRRMELGPDQADTLVFSKSKWSGFDTINTFRSYLLKDNNIRTAYDSVEQFPEWVPHLTLGYPDTPANPDNRDYPGISYVTFDRIAVWFTDFDGIEFPLKSPEWAMDMVMGNGKGVVANILTHHGVKGQKWGVRRKATVGAQEVIVSDKRKKLKTSGGQGHSGHPDAVRARESGQIAKKSGVKALSNKELEDYNKRLNLEQNYKRLSYHDKPAAQRFVKKLLGQTGQNTVQNAANDVAAKQVKKVLIATALA
jgi:2'-5' RNA ligase